MIQSPEEGEGKPDKLDIQDVLQLESTAEKSKCGESLEAESGISKGF